MRAPLYLLPFLVACGPQILPPPTQMPPPTQPDPTPSADCATAPVGQTIQATGDVSGIWYGRVELSGDTTIAAGKKLEICPGTTIAPTTTANLVVKGELTISGTREQMVTFEEIQWEGIEVDGKLSGGYVSIAGANLCLDGRLGSQIDIVATQMLGCRQSFNLKNGARFDRVTVLGGNSAFVSGGTLTMVDSVIDLRHPQGAPDCAVITGGGLNLDHVRITGCHCPLHISRANDGLTITNSIFDAAAVPVMIANSVGIFNGNNVIGGSPQLMDVGGSISLDAGGNYWGGGAAKTTGDPSQYPNVANYSSSPIAGAGPR